MKSRLWTTASLALLFSLVLLAALPAAGVSSVAAQDISQFPDGKFVVRVYYDTPDQISALADFDVFEYNNKKEQYVLVAVDKDSYAQLLGLGMRTQIDLAETAKLTPADAAAGAGKRHSRLPVLPHGRGDLRHRRQHHRRAPDPGQLRRRRRLLGEGDGRRAARLRHEGAQADQFGHAGSQAQTLHHRRDPRP